MPLIAQVVLSWSIFALLWGVTCCKMTRLAVYNECKTREMRRHLSGLAGFWLPEYILLGLVFPAGGVLSFAVFSTCPAGRSSVAQKHKKGKEHDDLQCCRPG